MTVPEVVLAEQVAAAVADREVAAAVAAPLLHWTENRKALRGHTRVLAVLGSRGRVDPPARVELRDGQIYRWYVDD